METGICYYRYQGWGQNLQYDEEELETTSY